eukprot:c26439_g1_i1.p1 GENE.c26439_g1_i1~~c26439_g1_i1.p1  ORF type:complete len:341 (-),score=81.27 c26439_g1_i1:156-1178(-)
MAFVHKPVLLEAVVKYLRPVAGGCYLDMTVGGGGHALELLSNSSPDGVLVGIDRDPKAIHAAQQALSTFESRFTLVHANHSKLGAVLRGLQSWQNTTWQQRIQGHDFDKSPLPSVFDGVLMDLGVSSPQFDDPARGFSLRYDGPVDMRMDQSRGVTVAEMLDSMSEAHLTSIIQTFGEEPRARRIARGLLAGRPWTSTAAMAACIKQASGYFNSKRHPATRTFQALRIAINEELTSLPRALHSAMQTLNPNGGRLAVISFHSLEDRIVKQAFKHATNSQQHSDDEDNEDEFEKLLIGGIGSEVNAVKGLLPVRRAVKGENEDVSNPRSHSARLRVFERTC